MIVTFTRENNLLRKETQSILNDAFRIYTANAGFEGLAEMAE